MSQDPGSTVMAEAHVLDRSSPLDEARRLAERLAQGEHLQPLHLDGLPLLNGECAYAEIDAEAWRWLAEDVPYERRSVLVGGPVLMTAAALASFAGNRRRRAAAQRAAAPQWRSLGVVRVVATDRRLLVWHEGAWWSVWYESVVGSRGEADGSALVLSLRDSAPYRLASESLPVLLVVLAWLSTVEMEGFQGGADSTGCGQR